MTGRPARLLDRMIQAALLVALLTARLLGFSGVILWLYGAAS
jgi:hypothetical protein